jgi:hypothetical protein
MMLAPGGSAAQQVPHLGVGHLREVAIPSPDAAELFRRFAANDVVGRAAQRLARVRRGDWNGHNEFGRVFVAQRA